MEGTVKFTYSVLKTSGWHALRTMFTIHRGWKQRRKGRRQVEWPKWLRDAAAVSDFLREQYPKGFPEDELRAKPALSARDAANVRKWLAVIVHHVGDGYPDHEIENKYGWKPGVVGAVAQKIRRAINKERRDGLPRTGRRRGRPQKNKS